MTPQPAGSVGGCSRHRAGAQRLFASPQSNTETNTEKQAARCVNTHQPQPLPSVLSKLTDSNLRVFLPSSLQEIDAAVLPRGEPSRAETAHHEKAAFR